MRRYVFTEADLYVGSELVCIGLGIYVTIGKVYTVLPREEGSVWEYIISDDVRYNGWNLSGINARNIFYPVDKLPKKQQFMLKMSGRLPE